MQHARQDALEVRQAAQSGLDLAGGACTKSAKGNRHGITWHYFKTFFPPCTRLCRNCPTFKHIANSSHKCLIVSTLNPEIEFDTRTYFGRTYVHLCTQKAQTAHEQKTTECSSPNGRVFLI